MSLNASSVEYAVKTLLLLDLVRSTEIVELIGDDASARLFAECDTHARELLIRHDGTEIDKTDGFLLLFNRPFDAVQYALAFHQALAGLSQRANVMLKARSGIHLGEIVLRKNPSEYVSRGAKPLEVDGLAKAMAARLMSLAGGAQTLMTQAAYDMAKRAAMDRTHHEEPLVWLGHGGYHFKGVEQRQAVFEVGVEGVSPLAPPPSSEKAWKATDLFAEEDAGWRPHAGSAIPGLEGWNLERRLGESALGELWLAHSQDIDSEAETICLDESTGPYLTPRERAFLFYQVQEDSEDRSKSFRSSGSLSCVVIASGDQQGHFIALAKNPITCGRDLGVDFKVHDPRVSRKHFQILPVDGRYHIRELQSRNGVFINGMRISGDYALASGDRITAGETNLVFYADY